MDIKEEMEAFEQHLTDTGLVEFAGYGFELNECGEYLHEPTLVAWECWLIGLNRSQAVPEWIDVSDHMPKEGEEVLVHHYGHIVQATKDKKYSGGFKQRNCRGWESVSCYISHWMSMSIKLPESYHFYYEHDAKVAKEKAIIEAQEQSHEHS
ncbi:DUF551 domain-containing protein [Acinetobacter bohemicus]|uniref:DUF551 domain-containing protein n=1 Tax=Acinetobacter bohemicus TaxID=1435036 RepID=UPI004042E83C